MEDLASGGSVGGLNSDLGLIRVVKTLRILKLGRLLKVFKVFRCCRLGVLSEFGVYFIPNSLWNEGVEVCTLQS